MGTFNRKKPFGRPQGEHSFGGRDSGRRSFSSRGSSRGRSELYDAVCEQCGKDCKVPFQPTSGKPVYCSDCFEARGNGRDDDRSARSSFGGSARFDRRSSFSHDRNEGVNDEKLDIIIAKLNKVLKLLKPIAAEHPEIVEELSEVLE